MQRYKPPMIFSTQKHAHMHPEPDGDYVLQSEAQAEIARLKAEIKRKGYEIEMHSQAAEDARQKRDTAWNDAIEAAVEKVRWGQSIDDARKAIRALKRPNSPTGPSTALQEAIEKVTREAHSNGEWTELGIYDLEEVGFMGEAIATILNAVVKGELK